MWKQAKAARGFTLVEVIVVLAVVAALLAILVPLVGRYVEDSRLSQAQADVRLIGSALQTFERDLSAWPVYSSRTGYNTRNPAYELLYGPGENPVITAGGVVETTTTGESGKWPVSGGAFDAAAARADSLTKHLVSNGITNGYPTTAPGAAPRRQAFWRGPYLESIQPDPWGFKYIAVVAGGMPGDAREGEIIFVISAGPNGRIETDMTQAGETELARGGDDLVFRVR